MKEEKPIPDGVHEVEKTVLRKGTIGWHPSFPPPKILKQVTNGIVYFCAGIGGIVGGSDLFTGYQAKVIMLVSACITLACGAVQTGVGVKPDEKQN